MNLLDSILSEITTDPADDMSAVLEQYRNHEAWYVQTGLKPWFDYYRNHGVDALPDKTAVLLSLGGTTGKAAVASMLAGRFHLNAIERFEIPTAPVPAEEFLTAILSMNPAIRSAFNHADALGISLAVPFKGDIPYHPSKLSTIKGLCAGSREECSSAYSLTALIDSVCRALGVPVPPLFFQGDAPLAHLGSLFLSTPNRERHSLLLVCGTGLALANDDAFILTGMAPTLPQQSRLFLKEETDNYQYQYLAAGKGVWKIMRRALLLLQEAGTATDVDIDLLFSAARDSRRVFELWEEAEFGASAAGTTILTTVSSESARVLLELGKAIAERSILSMLNLTRAAAVFEARESADAESFTIYLEGSIARNPRIRERLKAGFQSPDHRTAHLFRSRGIHSLPKLVIRDPNREPEFGGGVDKNDFDPTLAGAAAGAFALDLVSSPRSEPNNS